MEQNLGRMFAFLTRKSQGCLSNILDKYNLSVAELPFFMALQHCEGITQEELTAIVCVDKAVTTRAMRSLEVKGYIIRARDEKDKRQNRIYATESAKKLGELVERELLHLNDQIAQGIEPETLTLIYESLLKMEKNLTNILQG